MVPVCSSSPMFPSPKSHDVTYVYTFMWNISIQFPHISQMNMNQMKVTTVRYYKILRMQRHPPSSWLTSPFFLQFSSLNPQDPCDRRCRHLSTLLLCVAFGLLRGFLLNCQGILALLVLRGIHGDPRIFIQAASRPVWQMHNMGEKHSHISAILGDMDLPLCHALPLDSSFLWSFLDISLDLIKPSTEWSYNEIRLVTTCNNHYAGCARIGMCKYHLIIAHLGLTRNEVQYTIV